MDTNQRLGIPARQRLGNIGPSVATRRYKLWILKHLCHQLDEEVSIVVNAFGDAIRKSRTRKGRHNHVKRTVRIAAIFHWICKPINDLVVTIEGVGKAVDQQQRCRTWPFASYVDEMDSHTIYIRFEVGKGIEGSLVFAPVI